MSTRRSSHAWDLRFAETGITENDGELAEAVNALVVHLDHDDALEVLEDFLESVRQGMNVTQMQRADLLAVFTRTLRRIVDRAVVDPQPTSRVSPF